jgi:excisionase family DNA binding protein
MTDLDNSQAPRWFSLKEAADYLNVGEPTLYRWMRERQITYRKVGDSTRFLQEDLDSVVQVRFSHRDAERVRGVCPICRGEQLIPGHLQSTGRIYFRPDKTKFWTLKDSNVPTSARMCRRCGAIVWYGDLAKLNALEAEGPPAEPTPEKR